MQTLNTAKQGQTATKVARLGQINFINSLPVVVPLLRQVNDLQARIVLGTPSELNRLYAENKLDLGAMSSFFYLKSNLPEPTMTLIKGLSISSIGAVGSVLFFSKRKLSDLKDAKIAVPQSSATSINLLHVLLQEEFGITATFVAAQKPDLKDDEIDAALVIGDRALSVDEEWSHRYLRVDMGEWWYRNYRLPMTFGVWAARNDWAAAHENTFEELSVVLKRSAEIGLTSGLPDVIAESMARLAFSQQRLQRYFLRELNFDFSQEHERGLLLYRDLCLKHRLLTDRVR